jgi:predicted transcriptional regulator
MVDRRLNDTCYRVLTYIQGEGRVTNKMIIEALGYKQQCIQKHLDRLVRDGKITKVSRGLYELAGVKQS